MAATYYHVTNSDSNRIGVLNPNGNSTSQNNLHAGIYFKQENKPKVAVSLQTHRWGPNGYVIIRSSNQNVYLPLVGNIAHLITALEAAASELRAMVCTENERSRIRASITIDDLTRAETVEEKLVLLIERFRNSPADIYDALLDLYRQHTGKRFTTTSSQVEQDIEQIRHLTGDLIKDGKLVYGAKSRIGAELGVPNAGSGHKRITAVCEALLKAA